MSASSHYYVPEQSHWPIVATIGLFLTLTGLGTVLVDGRLGQDPTMGWLMFGAGFVTMVYMLFGWFGSVARESMAGLYNDQMDRSFRWGMMWFIFSEVMFFAAFFGALFYARFYAVPNLAGDGSHEMTRLLWPEFKATWPLLQNPDPEKFPGPKSIIEPWSIPLLNTVLLLTSSVTITLSHHALRADKRKAAIGWLAATIALGLVFLGFQIEEYVAAYTEHGLTLRSGIYGTTFFMLTGFHGMHVTLGAIILTVILVRLIRGHFTPDHHFGFEAASWYWHFVDVVWVCLFVFVYIM
ncbi:cytochrome c oxidase subunit 3 [Hahella sp. SMD15-11]|uniref:cytochrome-c oxidase n=1 Tax=Thermohahella caldifontis TaxID=3142973 RepID=A0AB39UTT2_9GAMM